MLNFKYGYTLNNILIIPKTLNFVKYAKGGPFAYSE